MQRFELPDPNAYTAEIDHFSQCIQTDCAPVLTAAGSRATTAALEALTDSARQR